MWIYRGAQWVPELQGCGQGLRRHRGAVMGSGLGRQLARQCHPAGVTAGK